ncbi:MAG TPA: hypothetical protein VGM18_10700 [Candidatus Sulfotelmatobacter sp.]|jgi:hypothetical protein
MAADKTKKFTFWQGAIVFGLMAASIVVSESVGLTQKWEDGVVYTVTLFALVITVLRSLWGRAHFLRDLAFLFGLHIVGIIVLLSALSLGRYGVPKLIWSMALIAEGFLIISVLWRRLDKAKSQGGTRIMPPHK